MFHVELHVEWITSEERKLRRFHVEQTVCYKPVGPFERRGAHARRNSTTESEVRVSSPPCGGPCATTARPGPEFTDLDVATRADFPSRGRNAGTSTSDLAIRWRHDGRDEQGRGRALGSVRQDRHASG